MRLRILLLCVVLLPTLVSAEIYKWKDKEGVIRYSDVPPPSNVKQEVIYGKKIAKPTGLAPLAPVEGDVTTALKRDKAATLIKDKVDKKALDAKTKDEKVPQSKEEAAQKRAQEAEKQKQLDIQKKAELEAKQANCIVAKQNLATFTNGGRISKVDENGNKQYLGDADISQGKVDAQRDMEKYCD